MHPLNALLLGLLMAIAVKRRNRSDPLGGWRLAAGAAGALFPYSEVFIGLMGPGAAAQALRGLTWSILLMPFYAFTLAGLVSVVSRRHWGHLLLPVVAGLAATWLLGALTDEGIFPFALLLDWRLGLGILNWFDLILAGLCILGLVLAKVFPVYDRDLARLSLGCVLVYVVMAGVWAVQAHRFGSAYAEALGLDEAQVDVLPQPLSPRNWRVMVLEPSGRLHDTLVNLGREEPLVAGENAGRAARIDALYKPLDSAVWRIYRRYGPEGMGQDDQRRVRLAWYAWQATPYGWLGRYAVFDRFYAVPAAGASVSCVGFKDIRLTPERGTYVVCPGHGGGARVFRPVGAPDVQGNWRGMEELIPVMFAIKR